MQSDLSIWDDTRNIQECYVRTSRSFLVFQACTLRRKLHVRLPCSMQVFAGLYRIAYVSGKAQEFRESNLVVEA